MDPETKSNAKPDATVPNLQILLTLLISINLEQSRHFRVDYRLFSESCRMHWKCIHPYVVDVVQSAHGRIRAMANQSQQQQNFNNGPQQPRAPTRRSLPPEVQQ